MPSAFFDELCKIAAAKSQFSVPQTRSGRRSMTVETLLRKEKDGSLYKEKAKLADAISRGLQHMAYGQGLLHGGLAEKAGKNPRDFDPVELHEGTEEEEQEHTKDVPTARQIAMDHLTEHPHYYEALDKMEKHLDEEEGEKKAWAKLAGVWRNPALYTYGGRPRSGLDKHADSWKPQWLEASFSPDSGYGTQNAVVRAKTKPGDGPAVDEGLTEGQKPRVDATYSQPTNSLVAPKEAAAWSKIARPAVMGQLVRSPTDTCPDAASLGAPGRMRHELEHNLVMGPLSDAQPLTGTSTDAYQRT